MVNRLFDRQEYSEEKRKKSFLIKSKASSCILEYDEIIYDQKICDMDRFTLRNGNKAMHMVK